MKEQSKEGFCFNLHAILYKNTLYMKSQNNYIYNLYAVQAFYFNPPTCIIECVLCWVVLRLAEHRISLYTVHNID